MPLLTDLHPADWIDPDTVPRPVMTVGIVMASLGRLELDSHRHAKSQLLLSLFRRTLGTSPRRYMAERRTGQT